MKGTKPTKILVGGDKQAAQDFVGPAKSQMEILKKQMSFQNRSQGVRRVWLHDDVYVECVKCFNYQECKIWVRPVVPEPLETEKTPKYEEAIYLKVFINGFPAYEFDKKRVTVLISYDDDVNNDYSLSISCKNFSLLPIIFSKKRIKKEDWEVGCYYIFPGARFSLKAGVLTSYPWYDLFFYLCPTYRGNHDYYMYWEYTDYEEYWYDRSYTALSAVVVNTNGDAPPGVGEEGVRYYKRVEYLTPEDNLVFKQPYDEVSAGDYEDSSYPEDREDLYPKFSELVADTYKAYHVNFEVKRLQQQNTQYETYRAKDSFDVITKTMDIENIFSFVPHTGQAEYNFGTIYPYEREYDHAWPYLPWAPEYYETWPYPEQTPRRKAYKRCFPDCFAPWFRPYESIVGGSGVLDVYRSVYWYGPPPPEAEITMEDTGDGDREYEPAWATWRWGHIGDSVEYDNMSFNSIAIISDENGRNPSFTPLHVEYISRQYKQWHYTRWSVPDYLYQVFEDLKQTIRYEMVDDPSPYGIVKYSWWYPPADFPWMEEWMENT